ncbi:ras association domain-containing protein 4 isoform X2 [Periplaneta americana]|uniref:ras association domain-containing protein 4 isoform X2 n=1 Tax=Periplaneta americana TaxID=6978 RepID=UPI0037E7FCEC
MWKCHKCGKPVYFAERKQSLGYDWHPECLRCEECGKRLNPGQHAEHKGVPYCHVPCYGALFGPQLFGHGTRVESHTSFGKVENRSGGPNMPRSHLESKLKVFNQFYDGKSGEIRSREVNGRLVLEGALRIHWGVLGMIHLKEDDDQRTVVTIRKRNSCRSGIFNGVDFEVERKVDEADKLYQTMPVALPSISSQSSFDNSDGPLRDLSTQSSLDATDSVVTEGTEDPKSNGCLDNSPTADQRHKEKRIIDTDNNAPDSPQAFWERNLNRSISGPDYLERHHVADTNAQVLHDSDASDEYEDQLERSLCEIADGNNVEGVVRRAAKTGSAAIRRRPGKRRSRTKLKRRCSINGHFYNRETSFFTPPHGSQMSVWITSLVNTQEVINLLLEKYKVDSKPINFALFIVRDNGEQRRLRDDEYPLLVRVMLGPHEDVAKLFLMDRQNTEEISNEVAQFLNLSTAECRAILERYQEEEEREAKRVRSKFREMRKRIKQRMEDLKVRL